MFRFPLIYTFIHTSLCFFFILLSSLPFFFLSFGFISWSKSKPLRLRKRKYASNYRREKPRLRKWKGNWAKGRNKMDKRNREESEVKVESYAGQTENTSQVPVNFIPVRILLTSYTCIVEAQKWGEISLRSRLFWKAESLWHAKFF